MNTILDQEENVLSSFSKFLIQLGKGIQLRLLYVVLKVYKLLCCCGREQHCVCDLVKTTTYLLLIRPVPWGESEREKRSGQKRGRRRERKRERERE